MSAIQIRMVHSKHVYFPNRHLKSGILSLDNSVMQPLPKAFRKQEFPHNHLVLCALDLRHIVGAYSFGMDVGHMQRYASVIPIRLPAFLTAAQLAPEPV
jgi:hypothetical protein